MPGSRFDGSRAARRRILDSTEVRSYLPGAAEEVTAFLRKHVTREAVIGAVKRTDVRTFPIVAVREAIMNAIVHADYAASLLKTSKKASPNCATASSAGYSRNWD